MTWTDDRIQELTRLWDQGHSASFIGKALGVSKNAVVGKAHRLKLAARPSPIRTATAAPLPRRVPAAKANLERGRPAPSAPALRPQTVQPVSRTPAVRAPDLRASDLRAAGLRTAEVRRSEFRAPEVRESAAREQVQSGGRKCLWPIGDPTDADFHFCGDTATPGKPYCDTHCAKAYITRSRGANSQAA